MIDPARYELVHERREHQIPIVQVQSPENEAHKHAQGECQGTEDVVLQAPSLS